MTSNSYLTVQQAVERYPGLFPTERALRNLIFKAEEHHFSRGVLPGNGLAPAIIRLGRKVLLDEAKLIEWVESHRKGGYLNRRTIANAGPNAMRKSPERIKKALAVLVSKRWVTEPTQQGDP